MTSLERLNKQYEEIKDKKLVQIILYIEMPTGETEIILNPRIKEKIDYINKTYDENLVHKGCSQIKITEYIITEEADLEVFDFGTAILYLKDGLKVARRGWNGKGIFLQLQVPDKHSKMSSPYIYIDSTGLESDNQYSPKEIVPWFASQTDILAEDWIIVEDVING